MPFSVHSGYLKIYYRLDDHESAFALLIIKAALAPSPQSALAGSPLRVNEDVDLILGGKVPIWASQLSLQIIWPKGPSQYYLVKLQLILATNAPPEELVKSATILTTP